MPVDFGKRQIVVLGTTVDVDTEADLPIVDIDEGMRRVAAQMGWWASVCGSAEKERAQADAHYRAWRGKKTVAILESDGKLSEYKVKAMIEADPEFLRYKDALATTVDNCVTAARMCDALEKRANQLQSMGAKMRSEIGATGMSVRSPLPASGEDDEAELDDDEDGVEESDSVSGSMGKLRSAIEAGNEKKRKGK